MSNSYITWSITQMNVANIDKWMRTKLLEYVGNPPADINMNCAARDRLVERGKELTPETLRLLVSLRFWGPIRHLMTWMTKENLELMCEHETGRSLIVTFFENTASEAAKKTFKELTPKIMDEIIKSGGQDDYNSVTQDILRVSPELFPRVVECAHTASGAVHMETCPLDVFLKCVKKYPNLASEGGNLLVTFLEEGKIEIKEVENAHSLVSKAHGEDKAESVDNKDPGSPAA